MQTNLSGQLTNSAQQSELEGILRACVHCGFCSATCPTYQILGDELDGPRGRIYLLKQMLEGQPVSRLTQQHLDRCLTCRSCETTCPSGVRYGRLLDIGRELIDKKVKRPWSEKMLRLLIKQFFPYRQRFSRLMFIAGYFRPVLPAHIKNKIPVKKPLNVWKVTRHVRQMLILPGCVQPSLAPEIDLACRQVLDHLSISLIKVDNSVCCGALNYHLSDYQQAMAFARQNIDVCWPYIETGVEAIVMTASGCGVMYKDYGDLLKQDLDYAYKAKVFSSLAKDLSEILVAENLSVFKAQGEKVAFQSPCTLQHGQQISGQVEKILTSVGYQIQPVIDNHLCCGSAGVYSILQPALADQMKNDKISALQATKADYIVTANIGCISHLQSAATQNISHWIELLNVLISKTK